MAESKPNQNQMNCIPSGNECPQTTQTETVEILEERQSPPVLTLRLQQPGRQDHRVKWTSDTVDNEFMGKKKSKCCCIYEKPKVFGESDTSSDEEDGDDACTPHCRGHKKKCYRHHKKGYHHCDHDHNDDDGAQDHHGGYDNDNMAGPSRSNQFSDGQDKNLRRFSSDHKSDFH
ncbi:hypothetical protein RRG08_046006 [Elysia crispata]|uniref:E3 ubiquitin-protein ligase PPP1R11 n=1 Tax=Elysia crispata TaxID=231223 RepID=A0AAE1DDH4_9GAST|nr:hypothetical protein RRG08_046006 [Elysia crispata]